ncbi:sugar kinase [Mesorhizobium sp. B2-4-19]|uniref:xylulokinase n=1 Tax=Mesorhizobium sp. B2-4-19 TaxID=2589930 RepID=UPI00112DEDC6|nr:FGGY family carbohydrate kinase [Mesorhizobium sp. B2-4-19]TPK69615.1 sugar kinase [Mesorhizobium sp. B2-4-19]
MGGHLTLGIDIGTTNVKAAVLDTNTGKVVASGSQEHPLFHPFPGWAEQDASNYWGAVVSSVRQCLEQGRFADDIAAVALSGLVGVTLPVSDQGRPLRQAMIWMDSRSEEECEDIRRSVGEATINKNNGNRIAPWFIDPKALWIKKHEPHIFNATHKFLSPSGYCTYRMCGNFTMNTGDAGLAYAYEYREQRWNESVARAIGIPLEKLPRLYQSHEVVGEVTRQAAEETGLRPGTIVAAGGTDISSAALGVGVTKAGEAYYSMGTGSNLGIMIPTEQNVEEYRILKWPHVLPGLTMFDGPMAFTGASLKWFRDQFGDAEFRLAERMGHNVFDLFTEQARRVPACSDGLLYLPYLGNTLAPNWNSNACGNFFGVRPTTTRAHFIRALIEGVAFDLYSNVRVANTAGVKVDGLILNGGPTKSRFWNQITASVVNLPLKTPDIGEAAPIGDAILAGVAAGIYKSPTEPLASIVRIKETIDPDPKLHERYRDFFEVWSSVYQNLRGDMDRHRALLNKYHSA